MDGFCGMQEKRWCACRVKGCNNFLGNDGTFADSGYYKPAFAAMLSLSESMVFLAEASIESLFVKICEMFKKLRALKIFVSLCLQIYVIYY